MYVVYVQMYIPAERHAWTVKCIRINSIIRQTSRTCIQPTFNPFERHSSMLPWHEQLNRRWRLWPCAKVQVTFSRICETGREATDWHSGYREREKKVGIHHYDRIKKKGFLGPYFKSYFLNRIFVAFSCHKITGHVLFIYLFIYSPVD